jgi:hypothetical protein
MFTWQRLYEPRLHWSSAWCRASLAAFGSLVPDPVTDDRRRDIAAPTHAFALLIHEGLAREAVDGLGVAA